MKVLYLLNNYEKFSGEYILREYGKRARDVLKKKHNDEKYINNWKKVLEEYPDFVPAFDEILEETIFDNFDIKDITKYKCNNKNSVLRYINEKNKEEILPKIKKGIEFANSSEYSGYTYTGVEDFLRSYEEDDENFSPNIKDNIFFNDAFIENIDYLGKFYKSQIKEIIENYYKDEIPLMKVVGYDSYIKNRERCKKIGLDKIQNLKEYILEEDTVSDEDINLIGIEILNKIDKDDFEEIKEKENLPGLKKVFNNSTFKDISKYTLVMYAENYKEITSILPEKYINNENLKYILENSSEDKLNLIKTIYEKYPDYTGILDKEVLEKLGVENYTYIFNSEVIYLQEEICDEIKEIINNNQIDKLNETLKILKNDLEMKRAPHDILKELRNFNLIQAKEKGYIDEVKKVKENTRKKDDFYLADNIIDILKPEFVQKLGYENISKLNNAYGQEQIENIVNLYEKGYFDKLNADEIMELSWRSLEDKFNIEILNKLIETQKIKLFDKNLSDFFREIKGYSEDYIIRLIDSDILQKCNINKIIDGLEEFKRNHQLDNLSLEQLKVYAMIKEKIPYFTFWDYDRDYESLKKENIERFEVEDLAFICMRIKGDCDKFNITDSQLEKLKSILKGNNDIQLKISKELFERSEFWNLDDKFILENREYLANDKILNFIKAGKIDKLVEINKEHRFIPSYPIVLDDRLLKPFSLEELRNISGASNAGVLDYAEKIGTLDNLISVLSTGKDKAEILSRHSASFYTDENLELFGAINIGKGGFKVYEEILENEEYLNNFIHIKNTYGDFLPFGAEILSNENIARFGYERIYTLFGCTDKKEQWDNRKKYECIPENFTKEQIDRALNLFGELPDKKEWYNENFLQNCEKNNIKFPLKNRNIEIILENGREENVPYLLTLDLDKLKNENVSWYSLEKMLGFLNKEIVDTVGYDTLRQICAQGKVGLLERIYEQGNLPKWKNLIDNAEDKSSVINLNLIELLDDKVNKDLTYEQIEKINKMFSVYNKKEKLKEFGINLSEKPEHLQLLSLEYYQKNLREMTSEEIDKDYEIFEQIKSVLGTEKIGRYSSQWRICKRSLFGRKT